MTQISKATVVWKALDDAASAVPQRRGYIYRGRDITYSEMDKISDHVAAGLLKRGFQKGDRIGIIGLNQPEWLYTYFAAAKIGAVVVGLNVRYRDMELEYILNQSETRAIVTLPALGDQIDYVQFFNNFRDRIPSVREYIFIGGNGFEGSYAFEDLANTEIDQNQLRLAKNSVQPEDLIIIIYTSGTTGRPKGAAITHRSQLASARAQAEHTRVDEDEMVQLALPFNHVGGITCGVLTMLLGKGTCELIPMFDPDLIIERACANPPTIMSGVPTMHTLLFMSEKFKSLNTDRVRLVLTGGSNAEPALLTKIYEAYPNATVMNLYGLSESSGGLVMSPWDSDFDTTVQSIGKPMADFQVKVVDKQGNDLPGGKIGELHFKGDAVAAGYFRMPEETAAAFDSDGWLHTGDMGYLDENGYITLMGRLKEMYIQGGFNVYPVEVENLISKHPKVVMVAGIGIPDPVLGEIGRYYIVPAPGADISEKEIREYCKQHLADYKIPKQIVFRPELPLTPVGKIMKSTLKEEYQKKGE